MDEYLAGILFGFLIRIFMGNNDFFEEDKDFGVFFVVCIFIFGNEETNVERFIEFGDEGGARGFWFVYFWFGEGYLEFVSGFGI